eukprot:m.145184 g.145184  ORF g.145184 m.145184 type:complete len:362 (-) comp23057_c0_seq6:165-1250(-)
MPKSGRKNNRKEKKKVGAAALGAAAAAVVPAAAAGPVYENALVAGCPGCHFVDPVCPWTLDARKCTRVDEAARDPRQDLECQVGMAVQDCGGSDESAVLSVSNFTDHRRAAYVSATSAASLTATAKDGLALEVGRTSDDAAAAAGAVPCVTFIARLDPRSVVDLCELRADELRVSSLSFELLPHPDPTPASPAARFGQFPLGGDGPFLCTQGIGGRLTHFFPESYHAFDLRCPIGTPLCAVDDGEIIEVKHSTRCTGIHCDNLTEWNSISLKVDSGVVIDFLHLNPQSARVEVGQRVRAGQVLCESGATGFAPEPHVHIEAHAATDRDGPSVLIELVDADGNGYVPVAGEWYARSGRVPMP